MSSRPRKPPRKTKAQQLARAAADRETRRALRRGRALQRDQFQRDLAGDVQRAALDAAFTRVVAEYQAAAEAAAAPGRRSRRAAVAPRAFPAGDAGKWVPIGPSVTRKGQALGRPRVTGRIRDIQIDPVTGMRAYAASAKGGVWYTEDAGATWSPVGGWAPAQRSVGGSVNAQTCGCLLVTFGANSALDTVLVGTGETIPSQQATGEAGQGGVGVLAALGPVTAGAGGAPWEPDTGLAQLEGRGIFRLARSPVSLAMSDLGGNQDIVIAATSSGAFVGTRQPLAAAPGPPPLPARSGFTWAQMAALDAFAGVTPTVTDVLWLPGGRLVIALNGLGVVVANGPAGPYQWVTNLNQPPLLQGRLSLAAGPANRVYVLGELQPPPVGGVAQPPVPTLWQIADITNNPPVATPAPVNGSAPPGLPPALWIGQRDYDQAIAVDADAGSDRVYIGGSVVMPRPNTDWGASLWAFQVSATPDLVAAPNVSRTGAPSAGGDGADQAGLIGNNMHGDVHAIRLVRPAAGGQHVWVSSDGGVFRSTQAGRVNTFASCAAGLAALEPIFVASHPTSSHFMITGFQDNGAQVRTGDTMWEETFEGDGGGVAFHPVYSHIVVAQWTQAAWQGQPAGEWLDPIQRQNGGPGSLLNDRENGLARFYSGCAAVGVSPTTGRVALGTNRVWLTDNLGSAVTQQWRVLPIGGGAATDARPGGGDPALRQNNGVTPFGPVVALDWASPTVLLVAYAGGIVRYTEAPPGTWADVQMAQSAVTIPATVTITDIAAVPGTADFYVTTTGDIGNTATETVFFFDSNLGGGTFVATGLRRKLDLPGPPIVPGPLDPAYAVAVDPVTTTVVYVGTATGVWRGVRTPGVAVHGWDPFVNGLPQATVQDLDIWHDPTDTPATPKPNSPLLLRAGVQSRGVWEVDLAHNAVRQTYLRVHPRDDRRIIPTPVANPRRRPGATAEPVYASPDIVVRPKWPVAAAPRFAAAPLITAGNAPKYDLWTFQTAFRWRYPSVVADGEFTDAFGDLLVLERNRLGLPNQTARIDQALWDSVVGNAANPAAGLHLDANGQVTAVAGDSLAVYRAPWQSAGTAASLSAPATEIDVTDLVLPLRTVAGLQTVYREPCTVDVLLHHRDARAVPANGAFAVLLWQSGPALDPLLNAGIGDVAAFVAGLAGGGAPANPAGWNVATTGGGAGAALNQLGVALDARLPRAVPIDVDLSPPGVPLTDHVVLFLAIAGSTSDAAVVPPAGNPATVRDLVLNWPYAACRAVRVTPR
jgi:hypothetical protein